MPQAPTPESLPTEQEHIAKLADRLPPIVLERAMAERPFEMRPVAVEDDPFLPSPKKPQRLVWLRTASRLPDDPALHRYLLAYASDHAFITTALLPHGVTWLTPGMQVASLDHVMWFHQPFRVDEWLLYVIDSPAAHGARGLVRGRVFTREGRLVASAAQEGLIRRRAQKP
jgi:acyl-CoA thioesterase-2